MSVCLLCIKTTRNNTSIDIVCQPIPPRNNKSTGEINANLARDSWNDVTAHSRTNPLSTGTVFRSTWLGVAEVETFNLDFGVKKCPNRKIIFGTFIYALWSYQNHKNPVGHIDTLTLNNELRRLTTLTDRRGNTCQLPCLRVANFYLTPTHAYMRPTSPAWLNRCEHSLTDTLFKNT